MAGVGESRQHGPDFHGTGLLHKVAQHQFFPRHGLLTKDTGFPCRPQLPGADGRTASAAGGWHSSASDQAKGQRNTVLQDNDGSDGSRGLAGHFVPVPLRSNVEPETEQSLSQDPGQKDSVVFVHDSWPF